jgi:hypothetical protein
MRIITAAAMAAMSASLWTAMPAQADPQTCVPAQPGVRAHCYQTAQAATSVCSESDASEPGSKCAACKTAVLRFSNNDQNLAGWACGQGGSSGFYGTMKPPCYVTGLPAVYASAQTGCDGNLQDDGFIKLQDGTLVKPKLGGIG